MKALNGKQKFGLWLGIFMALSMGVNPPWIEGGPGGAPGPYSPIYAPPPSLAGHQPYQIDYARVLLQWAMAAFVSVGMVMTGQEPSESDQKKKTQPDATKQSKAASAAGPVVYSQPAVAVEEEPRKLKFRDQSLGDLLVESADDPDYWEHVAEARGLVEAPHSGRLQLELKKDTKLELGVLGRPEMTQIVALDASGSLVGDEEVVLITALKELEELDLSQTAVTDASMKQISRLKKLQKLWLDGTKVTADGLAQLKALPHLSKVSLSQTEISDSNIISLKEGSHCEFVLNRADS
jgi:hypothetical protein